MKSRPAPGSASTTAAPCPPPTEFDAAQERRIRLRPADFFTGHTDKSPIPAKPFHVRQQAQQTSQQAAKPLPGQHARDALPDARRPRQARTPVGQAMAGAQGLRKDPRSVETAREVRPA